MGRQDSARAVTIQQVFQLSRKKYSGSFKQPPEEAGEGAAGMMTQVGGAPGAHCVMVRKRWSDDGSLVDSQVSIPSLLFWAVGLVDHWRVSAAEVPFRRTGRTAGEARSRLAGSPHG